MDRHIAWAKAPGGKTSINSRTVKNPHRLWPEIHPERDYFFADIVDAALKDDIFSMEHPLFALKPGDRQIRLYERNGLSIEIHPGPKGMATIHDKDLWIFCISHLAEAKNRGRSDPGPVVHFTAHSFLTATDRGTSGDSYRRLDQLLVRMQGTSIYTNFGKKGHRDRSGFGHIENFRTVERSSADGRMMAVSVTLPDWLYSLVQANQVLTLNRDYFRIRKPLDRRIYELVRKHCGAQPRWPVTMAVLHAKSGSTATLAKFRMYLKALQVSGELFGKRMESPVTRFGIQKESTSKPCQNRA
jgi:plasmid replication initiation protein